MSAESWNGTGCGRHGCRILPYLEGSRGHLLPEKSTTACIIRKTAGIFGVQAKYLPYIGLSANLPGFRRYMRGGETLANCRSRAQYLVIERPCQSIGDARGKAAYQHRLHTASERTRTS
jgi:hypothetical protein